MTENRPSHYEIAIKFLDTLINMFPSDSAYDFRGVLKEKLGDSIGALDDYTKALSITKKDSAKLYLRRGRLESNFDYNTAVKDLYLSFNIDPSYYAYNALGDILSEKKQYNLAIEYYSKQIASMHLCTGPDCFFPYSGRGRAKYYLHDFKGALLDLDSSIYYQKYCPWCHKYKVMSLLELGLIEEACQDYETIKELYGEGTEIRILMDKYCKK